MYADLRLLQDPVVGHWAQQQSFDEWWRSYMARRAGVPVPQSCYSGGTGALFFAVNEPVNNLEVIVTDEKGNTEVCK